MSPHRIDYSTPVFLVGSCFSSEIGRKLSESGFDTTVNPFGTLYNPDSVADALTLMLDNNTFTTKDLYKYNNRWLSFRHDTTFSSESDEEVLDAVNSSVRLGHEKLLSSSWLFVTFGTARVYHHKSLGRSVSNCHKIPAKEFSRELLSPELISRKWIALAELLKERVPGLKIVFTISPVRHWKDGPFGNQVSKSVLFIALDRLINTDKDLSYFPSYEMIIDDLRDYRYYKDDMLHPSDMAVEYVWEHFMKTYFGHETQELSKEVAEITRATKHRIAAPGSNETRLFARNMTARIEKITDRDSRINLEKERNYFRSLL